MKKNILVLIVFCLVSSMHAKSRNINQSYDEFERRLERIKHIAAESNGKIEITVLPATDRKKVQTQIASKNIEPQNSFRLKGMKKTSGDNSHMSISDPGKVFLEALSCFNSSDYSKAIDTFNSLLMNFPEHKISSDCHYWLGECYACSHDLNKAIREFLAVLTSPFSDKMDDAMMRVAMCYNDMGNKKQAFVHFQKLILFFPDSEYTEIVHSWLQKKS